MQTSKLILSALFVSSVAAVAHAAPIPKDADAVGLDMKVEIDGKTVSQPYELLLLGETGTSTEKVDEHTSYVINTTPTLDKDGYLLMTMSIDKNVDGKIMHLSSPRVATTNNEPITVEQKASASSPSIKLMITPTL